jgi:hypothetical protein
VDPTQGVNIVKPKTETDSTKLRQFLNNLGQDKE